MNRTSSWALALVAVLFAGLTDAQTPIGRRKHAAILLRDGTVLVAGGADDTAAHTLVVERFVPWAGWDAGAPLPGGGGGMGEPAAALLPDGRVLFVDQGARLYNPDLDGWEELGTGFPQSRRIEHTLTVLHDGRVLLAGGIDYVSAPDAGYPLIGAPSGDAGWRWKEIDGGEIGFALRNRHAAVLRPDGTVLLIGGVWPGDTDGQPESALFDPATDSFRDGGYSLPTTRALITATRRLNRDIFVFGDLISATAPPLLLGNTSSAVNAGLTRQGSSMSAGHHAVLYPTGDLEILGGMSSNSEVNTVWSYPASGGSAVPLSDPLTTARGYHTSTLLMNGKLLIVGGQSAGTPSTWELRDPIGFSLKPLGDSFGLSAATVTPLPSGNFLVVGGETSVDGQAVLKVGPSGGSSPISLPISGRAGHTATLLTSDEVMILGGRSQSGAGVLDDCWLVSITSLVAPKRCPPMLGRRAWHTATLLRDGKVLVAGGSDETGASKKTTMIFDPRANGGTWQWSTDLKQPRDHHAAVMEPSGRVMLIGGETAPFSTDWFELDAGVDVGPLTDFPRRAHTATLLRDGRILVAGGLGSFSDAGYSNRVEVYDPITKIWRSQGTSNTEAMSEGRALHSAVAMPTGDVVLAGGGNKADRWSPLKGSFDPGGASLGTSRKSPAVVLGNRGEVLVIGGGNAAGEKVLAFRHFLDPASGGLDHGLMADEPEWQAGKVFILRLTGAWHTASEASSGNTRNSSVSLPRLVMQRLDNGEVVVPSYEFDSAAGEFSVYGPNLSEGHWRAWAYVSGVPGDAAWFRVGDANTLAWIPDGGSDGGSSTDGGAGSDGGIPIDGYSASVTFDGGDPHYTRVKVQTTVRVVSRVNVSGISVSVSGSADLAICDGADCQAGNVLTFDIPGEVGPTGVQLPTFDVQPLKDADANNAHTVSAAVIQSSVGKVATARASFQSVTADQSGLSPGGCGCSQTPFGAAALWALMLALLRKARPKQRQRL